MASARRPTRNQATTLFSSFSVFFLALICLLALCPSDVRAEQSEQSVPEYGSVIGIGEYNQNYQYPMLLTNFCRFGNNVRLFFLVLYNI